MINISTDFYIRKKGSDDEGLHVCKRVFKNWLFQGVYPSKRFTDLAGKDSNVYFYAEDHKDILPEGVKAITSVSDWIYVLENLPDGVELYDDNGSGETPAELVQAIKETSPETLERFYERSENEQVMTRMSEELLHSLRRDDFIDREGWRFSYRSFS